MTAIQVIEVVDVTPRNQRNGKEMCFLTGSNQHGSLKCLIFADTWANQDIKDLAKEGNIVMVKGKRSGTDMIVNDMELINIC